MREETDMKKRGKRKTYRKQEKRMILIGIGVGLLVILCLVWALFLRKDDNAGKDGKNQDAVQQEESLDPSVAGKEINQESLEKLISDAENRTKGIEEALQETNKEIENAKEALKNSDLSEEEILNIYINLTNSMQDLKSK